MQPHPRDHSLDDVTIQRVEGGFPHSEILGSKLVRSSPRLIAAYHVLHRLSATRHQPNALMTLDHSHDRCPPLTERSNISTRSNPGSAPESNRKDLSSDCSKDICLPNISGANGCGPSLVRQGLGRPDLPNMLPLHDVKHPQSPKRAIANSNSPDNRPTRAGIDKQQSTGRDQTDQPQGTSLGRSKAGGARRVRTDDLKLAKLPLSQLSYGPFLDEIRASARRPCGAREQAS